MAANAADLSNEIEVMTETEEMTGTEETPETEEAAEVEETIRRLALSADMRKQRIDTVRLKLLKIAAKAVYSARYITFKLCSSCSYKNEFYETISNIGKLNVQLE